MEADGLFNCRFFVYDDHSIFFHFFIFHIFPHFATCFHIFLHLSTFFHIFPMFKPLMTFESHEIDRFQLLFGASRRHALHKADRLAALGGCDLAN